MTFEKSFYIRFDREKTQIIKGIAILTMIIHHCIVIPSGHIWLDIFGSSMKICISYFTFLVGFGYAFSKQKTVINGLHRAFKLLMQFWILLFFIFIPLYLMGGGKITMYQIVTNMFGLKSDLHWFSWYLYYYIYAMIIMPFASYSIDKFGWRGLLGLVLVTYGLEVSVHTIPNYDENIFTQAAFDCLFNSPLLFLGYYMARNNDYGKLPLQKKKIVPLLSLLVLVLAAVLYKRILVGFMLDFFYVPVILFAVLGLFTIYKLSKLRHFLMKLGDLSMPMWFIHALFIMPFPTVAWVTDWTGGNPWLKFAVVVPFSFILAILFNKLSKPLVKRI